MDACTIAGLVCEAMVPEPVAAALAFGVDSDCPNEKRKCLVFDFGGGTHDVTILNIFQRNIEVLQIEGDSDLGGQDIDVSLMEFALQ